MSQTPSVDRHSLWGEMLAAGLLAGVVVLLLGLRVKPMTADQPDFARAGDHHKYGYMAEQGVWGFHVAPFCRRIGVPLAVRILPFDVEWGFKAITFVSLWLAGVGIYGLIRGCGKPRTLALLAMLTFFSVGWATKYAVFDFWLPDPAALAIVTLALCCLPARRDAAFAALLALGVTVKESVLFAAPLYWTLLPIGGGRVVRGLAAVAPAVVVLIGIRMAIPAKNHDAEYVKSLPAQLTEVDEGRTSYAYAEQFTRISWQRVRDASVHFAETAHSYSVGSFGALPLVLPLFAIRRNVRLLARLLPFLILVYAQLLLATDTQRLLVLALPALVLLDVNGIEGLMKRWGVRAVTLLPLPILMIVLNLWRADRMAGPSWVEACIMAAYLGAVWLWGRSSRSAGVGG